MLFSALPGRKQNIDWICGVFGRFLLPRLSSNSILIFTSNQTLSSSSLFIRNWRFVVEKLSNVEWHNEQISGPRYKHEIQPNRIKCCCWNNCYCNGAEISNWSKNNFCLFFHHHSFMHARTHTHNYSHKYIDARHTHNDNRSRLASRH